MTRVKTLTAMIVLITLLLTLPGFGSSDFAGVMLVCNTTCGTGPGCMVTAACSPAAPNTCAFSGESVIGANMATVTLGAIDGMADIMASAGTSASASIYFSNLCGATAMCTMGFFTVVVNTCVVNAADGLPVELLDFSIDEKR